jgi:paraquat-inducible protein B
LGSGHFFTGKTSYVLYFDRDVNGLRVGAPVKFRGVDIGTVDAVLLSLNGLEQPSKNGPDVEIPVVIDIDSRKIESHGAEDDLSDPIVMKHAIALGLRGQLGMQSFVTGVLYVDLDMHPHTNARFSMNTLERQERYEGIQEIPTLPTALEQAQETVTKVIEELGKADLPALIRSFSDTARNINTFVQSPDLKNSVDQLGLAAKNLSDASVSISVVANKLDTEIGPLGDSLTKSSRQAGEALRQAQLTLAGVQHTIEPQSPLNYQLTQTLQDLSSAAIAVHELADMLERNPSVLVRGRFVGVERR